MGNCTNVTGGQKELKTQMINLALPLMVWDNELEKPIKLRELLGIESHGMTMNSLKEVGSPSLFPYSSCGLLLMEFSGGIFIGTAFQIGPYEILSCAHNFYQRGYN